MLQAGELNKLKVTIEQTAPVPAEENLTLLDPETCDIQSTPVDDIDCLSFITMRAPIPRLAISTTLYDLWSGKTYTECQIENFRIYCNMIVIYSTVQLMQFSHILPVKRL